MTFTKWAFAIVAFLGPAFGFTQATDYILNGDFEQGSEPHLWAQFDNVSNWTSETNDYMGTFVHSPDYFSTPFNIDQADPAGGNSVGRSALSIGAKSGVRYVGLGSFELIQQQYVSSLVIGRWYSVSMYVKLAYGDHSDWNNTSELRVMLSKSRIHYSSNQYCSVPYTEYAGNPLQSIRDVGSIVLNASNYPESGEWKRVSFNFLATDDIYEYDWISIDNRQINPTPNGGDAQWCYTDFLYIDNVSMRSADYCNSPCAPELGTLEYGLYHPYDGPFYPYELDHLCVVNSGDSWTIYVKNALGIDFRVLTGSTGSEQVLYEKYIYNVNGLKDPGFDDYEYVWWGVLEDGSQLPQDTYVYDLILWNCNPGDTRVFTHEFLNYVPTNNTPGIGPTPPRDFDLTDCCVEHKYYQNVTLSGNLRSDVNDFITAGSNVTSGAQGDVVVTSGSTVRFHAGNSINLEPGFLVQAGAVYTGTISDCVYGNVEMRKIPAPTYEYSKRGTGSSVAKDSSGVYIYPNPASDLSGEVVTLQSLGKDGLTRCAIYGLDGSALSVFQLNGTNGQISVGNLASGSYVFEISMVSGRVNYLHFVKVKN